MSSFTNKKKNYLVMWKGGQNSPFPTWISAVPKNSRPAINGPNNGPKENPNDYAAPFGKPRPLKIWRKQLVPKPQSGNGNINMSIDSINAPGGSVFLNDISNCNCTCDNNSIETTVYSETNFIGVTSGSSFNSITFSVNEITYLTYATSSTSRDPITADGITAKVYDLSSNLLGTSSAVIPPIFITLGVTNSYIFSPPIKIIPNTIYYIIFSSATSFNTLVNSSDKITSSLFGYYFDKECNNSNIIKNSIYGNYSYLTPETPNEIYEGTYYTNIAKNEYEKCISCDPESNIIKPGIVQPIENNYTDYGSYLQSKCSSIEQNMDTEKIKGNTYILPQGEGAWPSDSPKGAQQFNMPFCGSDCSVGKTVPTIYKPNNRPFARQGGVSASTRIFALKQNTCTDYNNSSLSANGLKEINYGRFTETPITPYFLKNQFNFCNRRINWRKGNPTACWYTPIADMYHQSLKTTKVYPTVYCQRNITIYDNTDCNFFFIGPDNNIETDSFSVNQNTIITNITTSIYSQTQNGGQITAFLYNCLDTTTPILASDTLSLPNSIGEPLSFTFNIQDIYEQPSNDKNFILYPGINYCIKFISSTTYIYPKCFQTNCIAIDIKGYYYTKNC